MTPDPALVERYADDLASLAPAAVDGYAAAVLCEQMRAAALELDVGGEVRVVIGRGLALAEAYVARTAAR